MTTTMPTSTEPPCNTAQKLAIFRACFSGLPQVYGSYDPAGGGVFQVKRPVTDAVILAHLRGWRPYGVYLLVGKRTGAVVVDFDQEDTQAPDQFVRCAAELGINAYIERSKRKGYHVWIFAKAGGVLAATARRLARCILERIGLPRTEVFPKQDRLGPGNYGNFINAPLWGNSCATAARCLWTLGRHSLPTPTSGSFWRTCAGLPMRSWAQSSRYRHRPWHPASVLRRGRTAG